MKINKLNRKEKVFIEEFAIILGALIIVFLSINFNTRLFLVAPQEKIITDRTPLFSWSGNYDLYELIVDDDVNFDSPILKINLFENKYQGEKDLEFGNYYWKIKAFNGESWIESKIGKFRIDSLVALQLEEEGARNIGNVPIKVDILENNLVVGAAILDVKETLVDENQENKIYRAEQNE